MKAKFHLKKGKQNTKFTRTLKLGNRMRSQTSNNSKKNLTINAIENTNDKSIKKSPNNKNKYNTIVFPRTMTNQKIKISNHIEIKSKDKLLTTKKFITEENHKSFNNIKKPYTQMPKINHNNNITIYRKINALSSKKTHQNKKYNTHIILKTNTKNNKNKKEYMNLKEKILFRTPLRIRKNGSNGGIFGKLSSENSKINITETNNNNKTLIENMKKEIEYLKKEKTYKNELIEKMRQQIQENKNKKKIINENKKLKKEIKELKANIKPDNRVFKDIDLFDRFRDEYLIKKTKVIQLKKEKEDLKNELNYRVYNNLHIRKNIEFNYLVKSKDKNNKKKINIYYDMNRYIENKYRAVLKKQGENINDFTKILKTKQINEIRFLIKMIFHSNKITKDILLASLINNLLNFNEMINSFIQLIKTKSLSDKKLIKNYLTSISFEDKEISKIFNINNLFKEINFYFDDIDKLKNNFDNMNISIEKNKKIFKACKLNDKAKTGIIELNHFNSIFKAIYGNFQNEQKNKEIYETFIIMMKNYNNLDNLDLYHLSYKNIKNSSSTSSKLSSLENSKMDNSLNKKEIHINNNKIQNDDNDLIINVYNNKEEDYTKICNDFVSDLFNDCLETTNEKSDIDNICKDFVANVFEDCLQRTQIKHFYKVCYNFVSDVFDNCLAKAKNEKNIKICNDFVEDVFDFCVKKNKVNKKET